MQSCCFSFSRSVLVILVALNTSGCDDATTTESPVVTEGSADGGPTENLAWPDSGGGEQVAVNAGNPDLPYYCTNPVQTTSGLVLGEPEQEAASCVWRGIPYAAPPVGALRWKAPQPVPKWNGVRTALKWGAICAQKGVMDQLNYDPSEEESEDCLYLNIWRPDKPGSFPVMVWIHGGAYSGGTGNTPIYWGDRLAEQGEVVVVTFNYRVGAFGFLAHPALKAEDPNGSTGNYGTLDQIAVLRWVKDNIAGFGGDPSKVTIFGESAGGWSVCTMMATPLAKGLFHRAIVQSGACDSSQALDAGYTFTTQIAKKVGCSEDDLSCLRAVSADKLLKYTGGLLHTLDYKNHHDGYVLSATPLETIRSGNFNRVPLLAGHNRDEFTWTSSLIPANTATLPFIYELYIKQFIANPAGLDPEQQKQLLALYPPGAYKYKPIDAINAMITDIAISCPTYLGALASAEQGSKTWFYRFVYDEAKVNILLGLYLPMGASHGIEIAFIFNTMDRKPSSLALGQLDKADLAGISETLMGYWTAFARGGSPVGAGLPAWSPLDADAPAAQVIDIAVESKGLATGATSFDARCRFWDEVTVPGSLFDKLGQQSKQ